MNNLDRPEKAPQWEKNNRPVLGITMGDPNGIGPELLLKLFEDSRLIQHCVPVIFGSGKALNFYRNHYKIERFGYQLINAPNQINSRKLNLVEVNPQFEKVEMGSVAQPAGRTAFLALEAAMNYLAEGHIQALVTLPINKASIQSKEFAFPGHTEYLTQRMKVSESLMLMVHNELRVGVVSGHVPLSAVPAQVTQARITNKLRIFRDCLRIDFNIQKPKIAVLGLNPHAGDNGVLGSEEKDSIIKAIEKLKDDKSMVYGPYSADGFFAASQYTKFDGVLAMYHDQGLIPFKLLCGGQGVNVTAGLPIVRTSPDHGTAYDIAGKGIADITSTRNAIFLAMDIARIREENKVLYENALKPQMVVEKLVHGEDSSPDELAELAEV